MTGLRALAIASLLPIAAACATPPARSAASTRMPNVPTEEGVAYALRDLCLRSVATRQPVATLIRGTFAIAVAPSGAGPYPPTARAWRVAGGDVHVVEEADGGCYVRAMRGEGPGLRSAVESVLDQATEGFERGRSGLAAGGQVLRTTWCSRRAARPLAVLVSSARAGAPVIPIQITVIAGQDAPHCTSNGPGDGSDRIY